LVPCRSTSFAFPHPIMEQDPLLRGGSKKIDDRESGKEAVYEPRSKTLLHAVMLGFAPWIMFVCIVTIMFEMWHHHTMVAITILAVLLTINVGFAVFEMAHGKAWLWWLGVLCTVAILFGLAAGCFNYYRYLLYFYSYQDLRKYTNVAGSQHAAGFADAAMMLFTKDTAVDTTSAVGMQDPEDSGKIYCVAPIVDGSMTKDDLISFWAVGVNCCEERANFQCDGAGDAAAKSGLVVLETSKLVSELVADFVAELGTTDNYRRAIKLQNSVFGASNAKENVFVRWTKDPVEMQDTFWNSAFADTVTECALYFVLSMIMGISAALQARPPPKHMY